MKLSHPSTRRKAISLAPLIDVVFILLLFFMLSTQFVTRGTVALDISGTAQTSGTVANRPVFIIELLANNMLLVDGQRVSLNDNDVSEVLQEAFADDRKAALRYQDEANVQALTQLLGVFKQLSIPSDRVEMGW